MRNARAGRSVTASEMNDQVRHFELDMSEPEPPPERERGRQHKLRLSPAARRWLAIIAALAVGAALGGVGVRKERDAAAAREARRTISLVAAVSGTLSDPAGPDGAFPVAIRIYNAGRKGVRILDATLSVPRFRAAPTRGAATTDVAPETWGLLTPILGPPDCSRPVGGPLKPRATVGTADRSRRLTVPVVDAGGNLARSGTMPVRRTIFEPLTGMSTCRCDRRCRSPNTSAARRYRRRWMPRWTFPIPATGSSRLPVPLIGACSARGSSGAIRSE